MLWLWLLPLIPLTFALIYTSQVKDFLEDRGLLRLGLEKSELEKLNIIRGITILIMLVFIILSTGQSQLIVGMIGIVLGTTIMYYSEPIHRMFAIGGQAGSKFRGDSKIKLVGLLMCILSAGWMSGITQGLVLWFFETANLIPSSDVIDYY